LKPVAVADPINRVGVEPWVLVELVTELALVSSEFGKEVQR